VVARCGPPRRCSRRCSATTALAAPIPRGSGLIGLRDRIQALDGSIEVNSRAGDGTTILVELPLQPD
jgi:signal transduction histidine kinase